MSNTNTKLDAIMAGKYCIIRGKEFGVFAGNVEAVEGDRVLLRNARRLWYWDGAASISQLATDGTTAPNSCKFTVTVDCVLLSSVIEIIPATEKARASINGVKEWKR